MEVSRFIPLKEVLHRTSLSKSALYRLIQLRAFARPIKLGVKSVWREEELQAWMRGRVTDRLAQEQ